MSSLRSSTRWLVTKKNGFLQQHLLLVSPFGVAVAELDGPDVVAKVVEGVFPPLEFVGQPESPESRPLYVPVVDDEQEVLAPSFASLSRKGLAFVQIVYGMPTSQRFFHKVTGVVSFRLLWGGSDPHHSTVLVWDGLREPALSLVWRGAGFRGTRRGSAFLSGGAGSGHCAVYVCVTPGVSNFYRSYIGRGFFPHDRLFAGHGSSKIL